MQRAGQVRRQFALDGEARAVVRICRLVEGLPLALNLLWGLAILIGIPAVTGVSLQSFGYQFPDLIAILTVSAVVALGWGLLRTMLALVALRKAGGPIAASMQRT